jgi:DNA-binding winged helix-turn-helix (wHTH) protein
VKVRFADCVFDGAARTVRRGTATIQLSPNAFAFLTILVEHRGRALSKVELLQRVWPDVFVSEASLARVVREIRLALGDATRDAEIVRTVQGYGDAFAATLLTDAPHAPSADRIRPTCWLTGGSPHRLIRYVIGVGKTHHWLSNVALPARRRARGGERGVGKPARSRTAGLERFPIRCSTGRAECRRNRTMPVELALRASENCSSRSTRI